jgi:protein-L-isoaspartate(D-aspartate) O-methyltransferase
MPGDDYRSQGLRRQLVDALKKKGITDAAVLAAIGKVPRHLFIEDSAFERFAYVDQAFPIGCGQTISQPYTVAFQSQLLAVQRGEKVLEIGTGCGYQTAVLSAMGTRVVSIERHRPLHVDTKARLHRLGYKANLVYGDGFKGAPGHAPFDRILVTCGAPVVPQDLLHQLKVGGSMVVPVGAGEQQVMLRIVRVGPAEFQRDEHGVFSFVPMLADKAGG